VIERDGIGEGSGVQKSLKQTLLHSTDKLDQLSSINSETDRKTDRQTDKSAAAAVRSLYKCQTTSRRVRRNLGLDNLHTTLHTHTHTHTHNPIHTDTDCILYKQNWLQHRMYCFTEESWASIGLEFGVQWVGVFTAT